MKYDYLIVGAGLYGATCAYELTNAGKKVLVIDGRNHIGGNCYTEKKDGINIHVYGPHIFHTSNETIWKWINQFIEFNDFILSPIANYNGEYFPLPFNMWTFNKLWGVNTAEQAKEKIASQSNHIGEPINLEEQAIKMVGVDGYEKLIKSYTEKQWRKACHELPKEIIKRLMVRFTYNNNYFDDPYQGIPKGGYTKLFEKLLKHTEVRLGVDYLKDELPEHDKVIYTGPIDKFFGYRYGILEYKTTRFEHAHFTDRADYQGTAIINYTSNAVPYTRIVEHKHFEFANTPTTWVTTEYPIPYKPNETEPYYPVNDLSNNHLYNKYKADADQLNYIHFGGRLGEYKYYDMHHVIESALKYIHKEIGKV